MSVPKLLFTHIRRSRPLSSLSKLSYSQFSYPNHSQPPLAAFHFFNTRSLSSSPSNSHDFEFFYNSPPDTSSKVTDFNYVEKVANNFFSSTTSQEEFTFPVRVLISGLDWIHDLTGLPWWLVIATTTIAMRAALFPLLVLQLKKLEKISEHFPKLPRPFPPLFSGKSYIDQYSLFRKERLALGCPSILWSFSFLSVQIPCFLLWMTSIRRMSLDHHPGFDCGGTLWFQNLTEYPHGISGPIFPLLIACLHYINVQLSFGFSVKKGTGLLGLLAEYYKLYLDLLTLPLVFIGYFVPQGSLVYWVTNSSLTLIQQISLKYPAVRAKLRLASADSEEKGAPQASLDLPNNYTIVPAETLNAKQLRYISLQLLNSQHRERAIPLLQLALQKDPDDIQALVDMGRNLLVKEMHAEAREHMERAISKLFLAGNPTEVKYFELLILASQAAGIACIQQGKNAEGVVHLERVASLEEPDDPEFKIHYFNSLGFLARALSKEGRKAEAANYARLVVAFNPAFQKLSEECEKEDEFCSDLVNSRRRDY